MIDVNTTIDKAEIDRLSEQVNRYSDVLGNQSKTAPRRVAIMICKSFRKATKPAKKNKRIEMYKDNMAGKQKYIFYKNGVKLSQRLRRWRVNLLDRAKSVTRYVSAENPRHQLREMVGTNYYQSENKYGKRGLAKQSWGWVMHNIFNGSAPDTPWNRSNKERNPKDATSESYSRENNNGGIARICNKLDYIVDALKGFNIHDAVDKAVKWIEYEIQKREMK